MFCSIKRQGAASKILLCLTIFTAILFAPNLSSQAEDAEGFEVIRQARAYSDGWRAVGVVVYQGKDIDYSAEQVGRVFEKAFAKFSVDAQAFTDDLGDNVTSVSFYLNSDYALGPFNATEALGEVPNIVKQHEAAQLDPTKQSGG